jgi:hypothetical protein
VKGRGKTVDEIHVCLCLCVELASIESMRWLFVVASFVLLQLFFHWALWKGGFFFFYV